MYYISDIDLQSLEVHSLTVMLGIASIHSAKETIPLQDKTPSWDLLTALKDLMEHPFEPLQELSLAQLAYKTIFLVAICSARRIGELAALDCILPYCSI